MIAVGEPAVSGAGARGGLRHVGLLYDSRDDLVAAAAPHLRRAVLRGDDVATLVDRPTADGLRAALGEHASRVSFPTRDVFDDDPDVFLRGLRSTAGARGRSLVLAQYSAFAVPDRDLAAGEDGINTVLSDLPLTMLCACSRSEAFGRVTCAHRSHPAFLEGSAARDNPAFRLPADRSPIPSTVWGGAHALRLRFGGTGDLRGIRDRVGSLAEAAGLRGESARAAVFAVHEAVVFACDEIARCATGPDGGEGDGPLTATGPIGPLGPSGPVAGELDVWAGRERLVVEIHCPRVSARDDPTDGGPRGDVDRSARLPRNPLRIPGPLRYVRTFCPDVTAQESARGRTIRLALHP